MSLSVRLSQNSYFWYPAWSRHRVLIKYRQQYNIFASVFNSTEIGRAALNIFPSLADTCYDFDLFRVVRTYIKQCKFIFVVTYFDFKTLCHSNSTLYFSLDFKLLRVVWYIGKAVCLKKWESLVSSLALIFTVTRYFSLIRKDSILWGPHPDSSRLHIDQPRTASTDVMCNRIYRAVYQSHHK